MTEAVVGSGTREDPWKLKTPSGQSEIEAYKDEQADPPALVVIAAKTEVRYLLRSITDLHAMLKAHGDWMPLGTADEQKTAADGTRWGAGTGSRRVSAAGLPTTSLRCWKRWV